MENASDRTPERPTRHLTSARAEAVTRAGAYLERRRPGWLADPSTARPNPVQDLWVIEPHDPHHDFAVELMGGTLVVVPARGEAYEIAGLPSETECIGLQSAAEAAGLPSDWAEVLNAPDSSFWWSLIEWHEEMRDPAHLDEGHEIYPASADVFEAFRLTPFDRTRVVILGQDPYPNPDQAHGIAFSVPLEQKKPASLRKIHQLLEVDLRVPTPDHGNLEDWARQGVLLLNTALTVPRGAAGSHLPRWKPFTDAVVKALSDKEERVVFVLWGRPARTRAKLIDDSRNTVIQAAHPVSRPGAKDPFLESNTFSRIDSALAKSSGPAIAWVQ